MSDLGERTILASREAASIARGDRPAPVIHLAGHAYVPAGRWLPAADAPKDGTRFVATAVIGGERRYGVAYVVGRWPGLWPHLAQEDWEIRYEGIRCFASSRLSELDGWMPFAEKED